MYDRLWLSYVPLTTKALRGHKLDRPVESLSWKDKSTALRSAFQGEFQNHLQEVVSCPCQALDLGIAMLYCTNFSLHPNAHAGTQYWSDRSLTSYLRYWSQSP